jgi:ribose transport system substrate-binding protein
MAVSVGGAATVAAATRGTAAAATGLAGAQAAYKQDVQPPTTLALPPVKKSVPTGKRIAFIYCGVSECQPLEDATKKAAAVLGWSVSVIPTNGTPSSVQSAWASAVQMHPAAVVATSYPSSLYAASLKQLKQMKIPVFNYATTDSGPTGNVTLRLGGPAQQAPQGKAEAAMVVSYMKGKANTLFVTVPAYSILADNNKGFVNNYKKWCTGCGLSTLPLPVTDVGTSAGTNLVVAYLRSHPSINFVAFDLDAAAIGLPAALKAAGLKIPFGGQNPTVQNLGYIRQGQEIGTVAFPGYEIMSVLVDGAVRSILGESIKPDEQLQLPFWIVNKQNIRGRAGTAGFAPAVPNLYGKLATIWGKKK